MFETPSVTSEVWALAPGFRPFSIVLERSNTTLVAGIADVALARAESEVAHGLPAWSEAHLAAWVTTYRAFRCPTKPDTLFGGSPAEEGAYPRRFAPD
jgi:hypothetical protein